MYKIRNILLLLTLTAAIMVGCKEDDNNDIKTVADLNVVITNEDTYNFVVTVGGEGNVLITKQASNFTISEFKIDSVTGNGIYTYKPTAGFTGYDQVELEKHTYFYDSEPHINKERVKINISVEKGL